MDRTEVFPLDLELTFFLSLLIRKPNFLKYLKGGCQDFAWIISLFFLIVKTFIEVEGYLSLGRYS
jgi:hypothetical protein